MNLRLDEYIASMAIGDYSQHVYQIPRMLPFQLRNFARFHQNFGKSPCSTSFILLHYLHDSILLSHPVDPQLVLKSVFSHGLSL